MKKKTRKKLTIISGILLIIFSIILIFNNFTARSIIDSGSSWSFLPTNITVILIIVWLFLVGFFVWGLHEGEKIR